MITFPAPQFCAQTPRARGLRTKNSETLIPNSMGCQEFFGQIGGFSVLCIALSALRFLLYGLIGKRCSTATVIARAQYVTLVHEE